jgi:hypothetical protein
MVAKYRPAVIMQEDNASWHKAGVVRRFLETQKVSVTVGSAMLKQNGFPKYKKNNLKKRS